MFVAERIRHEHHQTRFEVDQHDENAHVAPVDGPVEPAKERTAQAVDAQDNEPITFEIEDGDNEEEEELEVEPRDEDDLADDEEEDSSIEVVEEEAGVAAVDAVVQPSQGEVDVPGQMKVCEKSLTFVLANRHGFGSEVALLIRAAAVARHFGYSNLFIDDSNWNFGKWSDYFEPIQNDCLAPTVETKPMSLYRTDWRHLNRPPKYTKADHIKWEHRDMDGLDAIFSAVFVSKKGLQRLQDRDKARWIASKARAQHVFSASGADGGGHPLSEGDELVPRVFEQAYKVQRAVLVDVWKPNAKLRRMMDDLKKDLALEGGHSPASADEVVISVHCRLGDKHRELKHLLPPSVGTVPNDKPGLHSGLLSAFFNAASSTVDAILERDSWGGKPKLALMSDDVGAVTRFEAHKSASKWRVQSTQSDADHSRRSAKGGFRETAFNHLPLPARVSMAQKFVTDLTTLATCSDGIVLTASSNVGRLMSLLAGEKKAIEQGRVTSLDTRWFPSANFL